MLLSAANWDRIEVTVLSKIHQTHKKQALHILSHTWKAKTNKSELGIGIGRVIVWGKGRGQRTQKG